MATVAMVAMEVLGWRPPATGPRSCLWASSNAWQDLELMVTKYPTSMRRMTESIVSSRYHEDISHIDIQDDHIDMVDNRIDIPYPKSISHIAYRYPMTSPFLSDLPYRYPTSISRSYLVTLLLTKQRRGRFGHMTNERQRRLWSPD